MNTIGSDPAPELRLYDARRQVHYDKPRLRGWLHAICFEVALVLGTLIIVAARGPREVTVASIYAGSVAGMFGASALYHRGRWGPRAQAWLQRLDHLMIFIVIAGTATPPLALCLPAPYSGIGLSVLWSLTVLAASQRLLRMQAPEWVAGAIFIGLGCVAGAAIPWVWINSGVAPAILLTAGGLLYIVGAVSYHQRRPDPVPSVFGYHEVFHTFVGVAAACQYVAIACFIL